MHERAVSERHGAMIRRAFRPALPLGFRIDAVDDRVVSTAGSGWLRTQETRLESGRNKSKPASTTTPLKAIRATECWPK